MEKLYNVSNIRFENEFIIIKIDKQLIKLAVSAISQKLANASTDEKNSFLISPSGYGIHWPKIDEDLSISGILKVYNG